jgi:hypothetical protein
MSPSAPIVQSSKPEMRTRLPVSALVPLNVQWYSTESSFEDQLVHGDLDVRESRNKRVRNLSYPGRLTAVDCNHSSGRVVVGNAPSVMAAPCLGVAECQPLDLLLIAHCISATLTSTAGEATLRAPVFGNVT